MVATGGTHPSRLPATAWFFRTSEEAATPDSVVLIAAGRLGSAAAPQLAAALTAAGRRTATRVVLDVSNVDYISSAGIQAIEDACAGLAAQGKTLVVQGARDATLLCLQMARVAQI